MPDGLNADEVSTEPTDTVSVTRVGIGDIVSIPGTPVDRCRVRMVRSPVPGVIWLYLADPSTDWPLRGHVALPLDRNVLRHHATASTDSDQVPEDS